MLSHVSVSCPYIGHAFGQRRRCYSTKSCSFFILTSLIKFRFFFFQIYLYFCLCKSDSNFIWWLIIREYLDSIRSFWILLLCQIVWHPHLRLWNLEELMDISMSCVYLNFLWKMAQCLRGWVSPLLVKNWANPKSWKILRRNYSHLRKVSLLLLLNFPMIRLMKQVV